MIEDLDGEEMIWLQLTVELIEGHTSNHTIIYNNNYFLTAIIKTGLKPVLFNLSSVHYAFKTNWI